MSLKFILLGLLDQPRSGYDIKQIFEGSLKNFWNAELSQIYPLLSKLEREGYLESHRVDSSMGPRRRVYRRLEQAETELIDWLASEPDMPVSRIGYLAQVFFMDKVSLEQRQRFLHRLRARFEQQHAYLSELARQYPLAEFSEGLPSEEDPEASPERYLMRVLTMHHGILRLKALMDWCDLCQHWLDRVEDTPSSPDALRN